MCGIVGLISRYSNGFHHDHVDIFKTMLIGDTVRGPDSTGVFGVSEDGRCNYLKGNTDGYRFTNTKEYDKFSTKIFNRYKIVIGHNRKATIGKVVASNAHPFVHDHITLVHNGTLRNADKLATVEVDSQAIASQLAKHNAAEALNSIDGAFAIVWYNDIDKTLNLARNSERPLWLVEYDSHWAIASEPGLAIWASGREKRYFKKVIEVPTESIFTFQLAERDKYETTSYENFKTKTWVNTTPVITHSSTESPIVTVGPVTNVPPVFKGANWPYSPVNGNPRVNYGDKPFAKDDWIRFALDDIRHENGSNRIELYGYPMVGNNYKNTDFLVKAVTNADYKDFYEKSSMMFIGCVLATSKMHNNTILHVHQLREWIDPSTDKKEDTSSDLYEDITGRKINASVALEAIRGGCDRCNGDMSLSDIPRSIIDTTDANWAVICPTCVQIALKQGDDSILHGHTKGGSTDGTIIH